MSISAITGRRNLSASRICAAPYDSLQGLRSRNFVECFPWCPCPFDARQRHNDNPQWWRTRKASPGRLQKADRRAVRQKSEKARAQVIKCEGARSMARNLHSLPGCQSIVNVAFGLFNLLLHRAHFTVEIDRMQPRMLPQLVQLFLEFDDGLLKFQRIEPSFNKHRCFLRD